MTARALAGLRPWRWGSQQRRRITTDETNYIGLDMDKATVGVAVAEGESGGEVRFVDTVANDDYSEKPGG